MAHKGHLNLWRNYTHTGMILCCLCRGHSCCHQRCQKCANLYQTEEECTIEVNMVLLLVRTKDKCKMVKSSKHWLVRHLFICPCLLLPKHYYILFSLEVVVSTTSTVFCFLFALLTCLHTWHHLRNLSLLHFTVHHQDSKPLGLASPITRRMASLHS